MVKHIVVYTLKEGVNKPEAIEIIRSQLEPLVGYTVHGGHKRARSLKKT